MGPPSTDCETLYINGTIDKECKPGKVHEVCVKVLYPEPLMKPFNKWCYQAVSPGKAGVLETVKLAEIVEKGRHQEIEADPNLFKGYWSDEELQPYVDADQDDDTAD